jgi:cysteine desulfurase/selenocysteine lyase
MLKIHQNYRSIFVGLDTLVPILDGKKVPYISLDNAASTPALLHVQKTVNDFLQYYSSVHRGTGFKSQLSTHAYEAARKQMLKFVNADPETHICIFGKNTTEAINKLARRFPYMPGKDVVLVSEMEHHSDDLPWRASATVVHVGLLPDGRLDEADFDQKLQECRGHVALVAVTGASNVTGYINPVHRLARKTHAAGAQILVDCAQLAPHRPIDIGQLDDPEHLDYVSISAHKMYAPLGTGALIGRRDTFEQGEPDMRGGGEVEIVTLDHVVWSEPPEKDEAGSPNTVGAVAMAAAASQLSSIGMDVIAAHEAELTAHALEQFKTIPGLHIYGDAEPAQAPERVGVIPINLEGKSHYLVAAILGHEYGVGVRNGCFCAHPYLLFLMGVNESQAQHVRADILRGDRREVPGMIRISFGLYNTIEDVDRVTAALRAVASDAYKGKYHQNIANGEFIPEGWDINFEKYFTFYYNSDENE